MAEQKNRFPAGKEELSGDGPVSTQLRGETMAYALQSGVYNLAANFFEPFLNTRAQKYYAKHGKNAAPEHGTYGQNLAGEFAGDIAGAGALILAELLVPNQLHAFTRKARSWVDPLYLSVGRRVLADESGKPDYELQVRKWATFQERNLVRSLIIAPSAIAANIATQKIVGNPSPVGIIFAGKVGTTLLTTSLGLAVRFAFPEKMHSLDRWFSDRVFKPLLENGNGNGAHANKVLKRADEVPKLPAH